MNLALVVATIVIVRCINAKLVTSEDGQLDFLQLAEKYGVPAEAHEVITEDGYVLTLFHIPGNSSRPVLMMHGLFDSSDTYLIRGYSSHVVALHKAGYDVWVGNCRGNRYSRRHVRLQPDVDKSFWEFSFNEFGTYDLPAKIDYVINATNQKKISVIGHSQGTTMAFVLGSIRPEYNSKIKIYIMLAPICFLDNVQPSAAKYINLWPRLNRLLIASGQEELFRFNSTLRTFLTSFCSQGAKGYEACVEDFLFPLAGYDAAELEPEFLPTVVGHFPLETSRRCPDHYVQVYTRGSFSKYDYGFVKNLFYYNSLTPPDYDLGAVTMPLAFIAARNDALASLVDVNTLRGMLPNVVEYIVLPRKETNHVGVTWGRNMKEFLFPIMLRILDKYD